MIKGIIKKLLKKKNPNKYLETHNRLKSILASYGSDIDNEIWISSNKKIMHVTESELSILKSSSMLGFRKESEQVIQMLGSGKSSEIGTKYEPITATLLAIAIAEKAGGVAAKTAKFRAQKYDTRRKIKAFGEKFESMSESAAKDYTNLQEQYQNQLQSMTMTIGSQYDELGNTLQDLTKKQGGLKTGMRDQMKEAGQERAQEMSKLSLEKAEFGYEDTLEKYTGQLENSRMQLNNQLDDLKRKYQRAKRHDRWYENIG